MAHANTSGGDAATFRFVDNPHTTGRTRSCIHSDGGVECGGMGGEDDMRAQNRLHPSRVGQYVRRRESRRAEGALRIVSFTNCRPKPSWARTIDGARASLHSGADDHLIVIASSAVWGKAKGRSHLYETDIEVGPQYTVACWRSCGRGLPARGVAGRIRSAPSTTSRRVSDGVDRGDSSRRSKLQRTLASARCPDGLAAAGQKTRAPELSSAMWNSFNP